MTRTESNDITFHYPPELFELVSDVIPLLVRSKKAVIQFFQGAGVPTVMLSDWVKKLRTDRDNVRKHEIARSVLERLNAKGEASLRERREILKRITEFEDFSTCWENDRLKAEGLVARIRSVVNVKDSFTRMNVERQKEVEHRRKQSREATEHKASLRKTRDALKDELFALFSIDNPWKRGKQLESVLNRLFASYGILVKEEFTVKGDESEGIVEQIDGVIELHGHLYLVEVKWLKDPVGVPEVSQHVSRLFLRADTRGIFISASGFGAPAVSTAKDALNQKVLVLCELEEVVVALDRDFDLKDVFRVKSHEAELNKNPLHVIRATSSL